jgi:hypothetical protein
MIENKFGQFNCVIILSPGITCEFEFDGGGVYRLKIDSVSN